MIIIVLHYGFEEWYKTFQKAGFDVIPHPFVFIYDSKTFQIFAASKTLQSSSEFAVISYLPGNDDLSFKPNFDSALSLLNGSQPIGFAGIYNVPAVRSKRFVPETRVPIHLSK